MPQRKWKVLSPSLSLSPILQNGMASVVRAGLVSAIPGWKLLDVIEFFVHLPNGIIQSASIY